MAEPTDSCPSVVLDQPVGFLICQWDEGAWKSGRPVYLLEPVIRYGEETSMGSLLEEAVIDAGMALENEKPVFDERHTMGLQTEQVWLGRLTEKARAFVAAGKTTPEEGDPEATEPGVDKLPGFYAERHWYRFFRDKEDPDLVESVEVSEDGSPVPAEAALA